MATFPANTKVLNSTGLTGDLNSTYGQLQTILGPAIIPSGDTTGATDSAAISTALSTYKGALLTAGTFYISGPVSLGSNQTLAGVGRQTGVQPGSAWSGTAMVNLASSSAVAVTVRDMTLNVGFQSGVTGVLLQPTALTDPSYLVDNILVNNAGSDGFNITAVSSGSAASRIRSSASIGALGNGFQLGADVAGDQLEAGISQLHGFVMFTNSYLSNSKAWFSGHNNQTNTWATSTACGAYTQQNLVTITGSSFQQNALHGIQGAGTGGGAVLYLNITGCELDTNSAFTANTGNAIELDWCQHSSVTGNTGANNGALSPGSQLWGINVTGTGQGTQIYGNQILGSSGTNNWTAGAEAYTFGSGAIQVADFTGVSAITATSATPASVNTFIGSADAAVGTVYRMVIFGSGTQGSTPQTLTFADAQTGATTTILSGFAGASAAFSFRWVIEYIIMTTGSSGTVKTVMEVLCGSTSQVVVKASSALNTNGGAYRIQPTLAWSAPGTTPGTVTPAGSYAERVGI